MKASERAFQEAFSLQAGVHDAVLALKAQRKVLLADIKQAVTGGQKP